MRRATTRALSCAGGDGTRDTDGRDPYTFIVHILRNDQICTYMGASICAEGTKE